MYINSQYYEAYREESRQATEIGAVVRWSGYYQCDHKYKLRRAHERYFIIYVVKGIGIITEQDSETFELHAGEVMMYRPFEYQNIAASKQDPMTYAGLIFNGHFFDQYLKNSPLYQQRKNYIGVNYELLMSFRSLISDMIVLPEERDDYLLAKTIEIISNLNHIIRTPRRDGFSDIASRQRIEKVANYILDNYSKKITIEELAKQANLSKSWTQTLFKRYYHISPIDFQIRERIERAKIMMSTEGTSIGQISDSLGFSDQFYLSKMFKRYTGMSPKEYRNALRDK